MPGPVDGIFAIVSLLSFRVVGLLWLAHHRLFRNVEQVGDMSAGGAMVTVPLRWLPRHLGRRST